MNFLISEKELRISDNFEKNPNPCKNKSLRYTFIYEIL